MGMQVAQNNSPAQTMPAVSFAQVRDALEHVPVDRLPEVYAWLVQILEDADDLAAIEAARAETARTGDRGMSLADYLQRRGISMAEVEAVARAEGL